MWRAAVAAFVGLFVITASVGEASEWSAGQPTCIWIQSFIRGEHFGEAACYFWEFQKEVGQSNRVTAICDRRSIISADNDDGGEERHSHAFGGSLNLFSAEKQANLDRKVLIRKQNIPTLVGGCSCNLSFPYIFAEFNNSSAYIVFGRAHNELMGLNSDIEGWTAAHVFYCQVDDHPSPLCIPGKGAANYGMEDRNPWALIAQEGSFSRFRSAFGNLVGHIDRVSLPCTYQDEKKGEKRYSYVSSFNPAPKFAPPIAWFFPCAVSGIGAIFSIFGGLRSLDEGKRIEGIYLLCLGTFLAWFAAFGPLVGDTLLEFIAW